MAKIKKSDKTNSFTPTPIPIPPMAPSSAVQPKPDSVIGPKPETKKDNLQYK